MIELLLRHGHSTASHRATARPAAARKGTAVADTDENAPEKLVLLDVADGVGIVTWNRPERNNAYSVPLERVYYTRLQEAEQNPDVRVIVVTGAGKSFCPGMDSDPLSAQANAPTITTHPPLRPPATLPRTIRKPVI